MAWYQLETKDSSELDKLAEEYKLHPVHVEECRTHEGRIKVDLMPDYLFVTLKPLHIVDGEIAESPMHAFVGRDFCITVSDLECPPVREAMERAWRAGSDTPPAKILYLILDTIVDAYFATIDHLDDRIDLIEDVVLDKPTPEILQKIFEYKRQLIDLRRIIVATRDVGMHLQRDSGNLVDADLYPFYRDVYDHLLRLSDTIDTLRDLLNNTLDVYLSSVANRTNQVMKVLTVLSTIALPALVISGFYGMNLKGLPLEENAHGSAIALAVMLLVTGGLLWMLEALWLALGFESILLAGKASIYWRLTGISSMRNIRRRRAIALFISLGVCMVALAVTLQFGWIILNWRRLVPLVLGIPFFALLIAGVILNTIFLVREVRRNEHHDSFLNAVTHELKTPVASIRLYLETLQRRSLPEEQRQEFYSIMLSDSNRLLATIEQVLKAGEVGQRARKNQVREEVDLRELVEESVQITRQRKNLEPETISIDPTERRS